MITVDFKGGHMHVHILNQTNHERGKISIIYYSPMQTMTMTALGTRRVVVKAIVALQVCDERVGRIRVHHVHGARVYVQSGHGRWRAVDVVTVHLRTRRPRYFTHVL